MVELLRDLFDYPISIGTVYNRVKEVVPIARKINKSADLSPIKVASIDEIFHCNHPILTGIEEALESTPRTSSLVENLNSRLRNYFHLRKHLGSDYLELLQFFLNHRTFMESRKPERVGKSPAELMTGEKHPHWLTMLGFEMFQRA
ncbi:MAG: hypothetical protein AB4080_25750 [Trichodesmium sp.]